MRRLFPYPLLWVLLVIMWLLLNRSVGVGHMLLGALVAAFACWSVARLEPPRPRARNIRRMVELAGLVVVDVVRSNFAVIGLILGGSRPGHHSAFLTIPLQLRDPNGLALLACIITATPGSAWMSYDSRLSTVTIHVLDVIDEEGWIRTIKRNYESRLLEIFQ
jgi:multicomponent K+:H+ antiporter subunit E